MNPYKILGVNKNASQDEIKNAFRKKALEHHPDKGGNEEKFKQINEAYSMISDPGKRSRHDATRDGFDFGFFNDSPFGSMFGDMFGTRKKKSKPKPTTGDDIVFDLRVTLKQVEQGVKHNVVFEKNVSCGFCHGQGGEGEQECYTCDGNGILISQPNAYTFQQKACHHCRGSGTIFTKICINCSGQGVKKIKDSVSFVITKV